MTEELHALGIAGIPEVCAGDDLAALIAEARPGLRDGDVVVVTSKVVSKAEGRVRYAAPGDDRDRLRTDAITAETVRVVARRGPTRIVQTAQGLVLAAAGVDASNTAEGSVVLLPVDPDASARAIRAGLGERLGVSVAVVVTDTLGRPWRTGQTDVTIGAAGLTVLDDHRGRLDAHGRALEVTEIAIGDEAAAAADLVKGKATGVPVAVVRGLSRFVTADDGPGARALVRPAELDMFPLGSREVLWVQRTVREFTDVPVPKDVLLRAVAAAVAVPTRAATVARFVLVESAEARDRLTPELQGSADLEVLWRAPTIVVPCIEPGTAEPDLALLTGGGAVERLLLALAVEGFGSACLTSALTRADAMRAALDLPATYLPLGVVAVGRPLAALEPAGEQDAGPNVLSR